MMRTIEKKKHKILTPQKEKKLDPSWVHAEPSHWLHEAFVFKTVCGTESSRMPSIWRTYFTSELLLAAIGQAWWILLEFHWTVFNACRDLRDTLVALLWWLFFLISLSQKGLCVSFFSNFVINEKTICFLPNQFLLIPLALTGANHSSKQVLKH